MFVDTAKVFISAGKGGDGAVSFRHELYVAKGGPDGGVGGDGGDVVFVADSGLNTLIDFRYKPELKAKSGDNGSKCDRSGAAGSGNAHFKSSVRQTPRIAEKGEMGETFEAELELKLLADVGLVGFPNAGKSTFLSVVSNARPEIADYAFTTLSPNLGVADIDDGSMLIADIPGLIEGASEGKGLGTAFLRHVERTAVLLHLIDAYSNDVAEAYKIIRGELKNYSVDLTDRPEIIAITKIDGLDDDIVQMQIDAVKAVSGKTEVFAISSTAHKGLQEVLRALRKKVVESRAVVDEVENDDEELETISLSNAKIAESWAVERVEAEDGTISFVVTGDKIERFARRTNFDNYDGLNRLRDIMKKLGISHELRRRGVEGTSVIRIGESEFPFLEQ